MDLKVPHNVLLVDSPAAFHVGATSRSAAGAQRAHEERCRWAFYGATWYRNPLLAASATLLSHGHRTRCHAATAMKRITKTVTKTQTQTKKDLWGLVVNAPVRKDRWWQFWKPVVIRVGLQVFTVPEFAERLRSALPDLLTIEKAQKVASELVESAMVKDVGSALVLVDSREKAERWQRQLLASFRDLDASVVEMG
eukprot:TRINITY_DN25171_c0_g1_i1.p1 TRINITY_DN25171_c0_g1~~TRINITY_DN25171_c0_g1_i1.p1  ORF type:complete len:196 (+),score=29.18 TRINITY_DN25171_c0_g1_i1:23-610(+)